MTLTATATVFGIAALAARDTARDQTVLATARLLSAQSDAVRSSDVRRSLQLALAADSIDPTQATATSMATTLAQSPLLATLDRSEVRTTIAFGHTSAVFAATVGDDTVSLWDTRNPAAPRRAATLTVPGSYAPDIAFSPDDRLLAYGDGRSIEVWNVAALDRPVKIAAIDVFGVLHDASRVMALAFGDEGRSLAMALLDGEISIWDARDPHRPPTVLNRPINYDVGAVAFTPDLHFAVVGQVDKGAQLWDLRTGATPSITVLKGQAGAVSAVAVSHNGRWVVTGSDDRTTYLWDLFDPAHPLHVGTLLGQTGPITAVAVNATGTSVATGSADTTVVTWDTTNRDTPRRTGATGGDTSEIHAVDFAADGRTIAVAADFVGLWGQMSRFAPAPMGSAAGNQPAVRAAALSGTHVLATANTAGALTLWDVSKPGYRAVVGRIDATGVAVDAIAFAETKLLLAVGRDDGAIDLWDVSTPAAPRRLSTIPHDYTPPNRAQQIRQPVGALAFVHGDLSLLAGNGLSVELWNISNRSRPVLTNDTLGVNGQILSLRTSPNERVVAVGSDGAGLFLYDISNDTTLTDLHRTVPADPFGGGEDIQALAFSNDGALLASSGMVRGAVDLWDVPDPARARLLASVVGPGGTVGAVAISRDGRTLAGGGAAGGVGLWDVSDPTRPAHIGLLLGDGHAVQIIAFNASSGSLTTVSAGGTVATWDGRPPESLSGHLHEDACRAAGGGLDEQQWAAAAPGVAFRSSCP